MTKIIFRVWEHNKVVEDIDVKLIYAPNLVNVDDVVSEYKKVQAKYPTAEVMFIVEEKIWQRVEFSSELGVDNVMVAIRALDSQLKKGIL